MPALVARQHRMNGYKKENTRENIFYFILVGLSGLFRCINLMVLYGGKNMRGWFGVLGMIVFV